MNPPANGTPANTAAGKPVLTIVVNLTDKDIITLGLPGPPKTPYDKALLVGVLARATQEMAQSPLAVVDPMAVEEAPAGSIAALLQKRGK